MDRGGGHRSSDLGTDEPRIDPAAGGRLHLACGVSDGHDAVSDRRGGRAQGKPPHGQVEGPALQPLSDRGAMEKTFQVLEGVLSAAETQP